MRVVVSNGFGDLIASLEGLGATRDPRAAPPPTRTPAAPRPVTQAVAKTGGVSRAEFETIMRERQTAAIEAGKAAEQAKREAFLKAQEAKKAGAEAATRDQVEVLVVQAERHEVVAATSQRMADNAARQAQAAEVRDEALSRGDSAAAAAATSEIARIEAGTVAVHQLVQAKIDQWNVESHAIAAGELHVEADALEAKAAAAKAKAVPADPVREAAVRRRIACLRYRAREEEQAFRAAIAAGGSVDSSSPSARKVQARLAVALGQTGLGDVRGLGFDPVSATKNVAKAAGSALLDQGQQEAEDTLQEGEDWLRKQLGLDTGQRDDGAGAKTKTFGAGGQAPGFDPGRNAPPPQEEDEDSGFFTLGNLAGVAALGLGLWLALE
jgi:hypothetical protein